MKLHKIFTLFLFVFGFTLAHSAVAQTKTDTIVIKTSAVCEMCKAAIERAVSFEKGVKKVNLNVDTRELTVVYQPGKGNPDNFRKAVSKTGYDADDVPAEPKAYEKIDECCKKENSVH